MCLNSIKSLDIILKSLIIFIHYLIVKNEGEILCIYFYREFRFSFVSTNEFIFNLLLLQIKYYRIKNLSNSTDIEINDRNKAHFRFFYLLMKQTDSY